MKYPASHLTPFLGSPPENSHLLNFDLSPICATTREVKPALSYSSKLFVDAKKVNSFAIKQIQTLLQKQPGWGGVFLCDSSTFSAPLRYRRSRCVGPLFSRTYKLPPRTHRFASPAFSFTYKLLFSQLACFQKHLRCPLVFPFFSPLVTRHSPLPNAIVSHNP
jgi:hypothetical protein